MGSWPPEDPPDEPPDGRDPDDEPEEPLVGPREPAGVRAVGTVTVPFPFECPLWLPVSPLVRPLSLPPRPEWSGVDVPGGVTEPERAALGDVADGGPAASGQIEPPGVDPSAPPDVPLLLPLDPEPDCDNPSRCWHA